MEWVFSETPVRQTPLTVWPEHCPVGSTCAQLSTLFLLILVMIFPNPEFYWLTGPHFPCYLFFNWENSKQHVRQKIRTLQEKSEELCSRSGISAHQYLLPSLYAGLLSSQMREGLAPRKTELMWGLLIKGQPGAELYPLPWNFNSFPLQKSYNPLSRTSV